MHRPGLPRPPAEQWQRNLWAMRVAGFGHYFVHSFSFPFLPLFIRSLGAPEADVAFWAGAAYTVSPLLNGLLGPVWAKLADRFGPRAMLQRSLAVAGLAAAATGLAGSPEQVVLARAAVGIFGGFTVASIVALTTSTPRRHVAAAMGSFQMSQTIGAIAGPLIGGALADTLGVRAAFLASGLGFIPVIAIASVLYRDLPPAADDEEESVVGATQTLRGGTRAVIASGVPLLLMALYILNFADSALNPVLPLYLAALGAPPESLATVAGAVVAAAGAGAAASSFVLGRIGGRLGARRVLVAVLAAGGVLSLALAQAPTWWLLGAGRIALGAVVGGGPALAYSAAALAAPAGHRGTAMGFMTTGALLGLASGPLVAGLTARAGVGAIFLFSAAFYTLAALVLLASARRAARARRKTAAA